MNYPPIIDFAPLLIWTLLFPLVLLKYETHCKLKEEDYKGMMSCYIWGAILWLIIGICV